MIARSQRNLWFLLRHTLFWFSVWFCLALYFSTTAWALHPIDLWYAAFYLPGLMVMVYINRQFLIPRLIRKNKPIAFFLIASEFASGLGILIHQGLFELFSSTFLTEYFFGPYNGLESIAVHTLILIIALGLHFSRAWYIQQTHIRDIQTARLQSEIRLLRSQLEPHFLFNSLNTIYALSLRQDSRTPQAVLILSELMRYVQLASGKKAVNLREEWAFLEKYKTIQSLRLEKGVKVSFQSEGRLEDALIAPLLLINPVENAFKHLARSKDGSGLIDVYLRLEGDTLKLTVQNSYKPEEDSDKPSTGLRHLKKQLQIHYPDKHTLSVKPGIDLFLLEMTIDLS